VVGRDIQGRPAGRAAQRARPTAYLEEVKYTIDDAVHGGALQRALDQHKDLARALRDNGMDVEVLPVIIGSMGTTRNDTRKHLQVLGIEPDEVQKLLDQLWDESLEYAAKIARAHREPNVFRSRQEAHAAKRAKRQRAAQRAADGKRKPKTSAVRDSDWQVPAGQKGWSASQTSCPERTSPMNTRAHAKRKRQQGGEDGAKAQEAPGEGRQQDPELGDGLQPGLGEGCPGVLHGGIGSLPSSQDANTLHHMPRDSAERKTNTPDRHRQPNRCRTNREADLPRQSERLRDRKREAAVLQRQRRGTADAADLDWCPTAGQNSDAESEHGCVEGDVAIRSRRRCCTLTERGHAARASSAVGAPDTRSGQQICLSIDHPKRKRTNGESRVRTMPRLFLSQTSIRVVCVRADGAVVQTRHVVERPAAKRSRSEPRNTCANKRHGNTAVEASTATTAADSDHEEPMPGFLVDPG